MRVLSKAIILIAGRGTRLKPLTDKVHKCLTKVNGTPILFNALHHLQDNGVREVILVVGYLGEQIRRKVGQKFGKMKVSYVNNPIYYKTNTSYSLWLAMRKIEESILILEGDVFFEESLLKKFLFDPREDLTVLEKYNPTLDGTFASLGKNFQVVGWVHKKDRPEGFAVEDKYKTVNIHKFSKNFVEKWLKPFLTEHATKFEGVSPVEFVFRDIINSGGKIEGYINAEKWFEIDDVNDLRRAEEIFKNEQK